MSKRLMACVALLALLAPFAALPARAEVKLAYVDVQRALNECNAGKKAKAAFKNKVAAIESRLQREQDEVQSLKNELEQKGMLMKPDQRQNLQDDYSDKLKTFERNYKDSKDELEQKDNEETGKIVHDLAQVIRELGERDGYTMVMEKGTILWGAPGIDITSEVVQRYNSMSVQPGSLGMNESDQGDEEQAQSAAPQGDFGSSASRRSTISK